MGLGDVLMSIGEAKRLHRSNNLPVQIVGRDGRPIRSDLFKGIPYIIQRPIRTPYQRLINGPGVRPYIAGKTAERWTWRLYIPEPAEIVFTPDELAFAKPFAGSILIEPNVKDIGHTNKDWGRERWGALLRPLRDMGIVPLQCGPSGSRWLGVRHVVTPTFRHAMAVLSVCKAAILPEGGLHHAAAAVGTPAVVIFGGFIGPDVTGYSQHRNLFTGGKACGMRTNCAHCKDAMAKITPTRVIDELKGILK